PACWCIFSCIAGGRRRERCVGSRRHAAGERLGRGSLHHEHAAHAVEEVAGKAANEGIVARLGGRVEGDRVAFAGAHELGVRKNLVGQRRRQVVAGGGGHGGHAIGAGVGVAGEQHPVVTHGGLGQATGDLQGQRNGLAGRGLDAGDGELHVVTGIDVDHRRGGGLRVGRVVVGGAVVRSVAVVPPATGGKQQDQGQQGG